MAIKIIASYSKRLGLPGYSSHQYSVTLESEIPSSVDIEGEAARVYQQLQESVDKQLQNVGFVPPPTYGTPLPSDLVLLERMEVMPPLRAGRWNCSLRQRALITALIDDSFLNWDKIDSRCVARFGKGLSSLSKIEASQLIELLLGRLRETASQPNRASEILHSSSRK